MTAAIISAAKAVGFYRPYASLTDFGDLKRQRSGESEIFAVTDISSTGDNVLLDDAGNLRFIDPLIRLKKPAREVIDRLLLLRQESS